MIHIPVLQKEVLRYLNPKANENFIDCTIGGGGHTLAILEKAEPKGRILGIDLDSEIIRHLKSGIRNSKLNAGSATQKMKEATTFQHVIPACLQRESIAVCGERAWSPDARRLEFILADSRVVIPVDQQGR